MEPLGTDQWYLDKIKEDYQNPRYKGYDRVNIGYYNLNVLGFYPEADFEYLRQQFRVHQTRGSQDLH